MKNLCMAFLVFLLPLCGFSQTAGKEKKAKEKPKVYLNASAGVSIPLGDYANDDTKDKKSGYAKTGYYIDVNADWMGKSDFGLAFRLMYQNNERKAGAKMVISNGDTVAPGRWSNIYLMAGPVLVKYVKKLAVDANIMAGLLISGCPAFKTVDPETKMQAGGTGTGFAIGLNVGLGYVISPKVTLKATVGYLAGFPKISKQYNATVIGIDSITGQYVYSAPVDYEVKKTTSSFTSGLGVIFKF